MTFVAIGRLLVMMFVALLGLSLMTFVAFAVYRQFLRLSLLGFVVGAVWFNAMLKSNTKMIRNVISNYLCRQNKRVGDGGAGKNFSKVIENILV